MKLGFDILFFAVVGLGVAGSFFLGEEKSQRMAIGVLVGSFAVTQFSEPLTKLLNGKVGFVAPSIIAIVIMSLCVAICVLGKNVRDKRWPKSKLKATVSGFMSGLVATAYVVYALPEVTRNSLVTDHNLAAMVYDSRIYLAAVLTIWLLITYLTVGKAKR